MGRAGRSDFESAAHISRGARFDVIHSLLVRLLLFLLAERRTRRAERGPLAAENENNQVAQPAPRRRD